MHKIMIVALALSVSACAAKTEAVQSSADKSAMASQGYVKPGAGIGYTHNLKGQYQPGETVSFTLGLGESYESGVMRVDVSAEGVQLLAASGPAGFDMAGASEHEMRISFNTGSNGRHYINVRAEADIGDGNPMSRVFSIPVQVGLPTAQKPNPAMETMEGGENIIVMDAEEEIK